MKKSDQTRRDILEKASELIYINGYQSTSIDEILARTKVTKGAFYYHFNTKDQMGLAVIREVVLPDMYNVFVEPLKKAKKPAKDIYKMIKHLFFEIPFIEAKFGCPVANLIQETSTLNVDFRLALSVFIEQWNEALKECIINGRKVGKIRSDVDEEQVSYFIMSGYWGVRSLGKLYNSTDSFTIYLKELKRYLKTLQ